MTNITEELLGLRNEQFMASIVTCTNCKEPLTFTKWFSEDCPKGDQLQAIGHFCSDWSKIPMQCPECEEWKPDDDRVAEGMKCHQCAGYGTEEQN